MRGWTDTVVKVIKQPNEGNWSNLERPQGEVKKKSEKGLYIVHVRKVSTSPAYLITCIKISVFENTYSIYENILRTYIAYTV